ncbi:MAG: response regulator [Verrucomicrobiota bacterium]|nr:response regulator [Verrucomicrobiota bacterium]
MTPERKSIVILIVDDDLEDRMLAKKALLASRLSNKVFFVEDGQDALDFLHQRNKYSDSSIYPQPDLILLDLNMPKVNGHQVLEEIKKSQTLKSIPVVILTTSQAEEDIVRSYYLGTNSYISKPVSFDGLVQVMKELNNYWFDIIRLPNKDNLSGH